MTTRNKMNQVVGYDPPHFSSKTKRYNPKRYHGWGFVTFINSDAVDQLVYVTYSIQTAYDLAMREHAEVVETTSFNDSCRRIILKAVGCKYDFMSIWFTSNLSELKGEMSKWVIS